MYIWNSIPLSTGSANNVLSICNPPPHLPTRQRYLFTPKDMWNIEYLFNVQSLLQYIILMKIYATAIKQTYVYQRLHVSTPQIARGVIVVF